MSFNVISFIRRATLGAVPVADDQPLPTMLTDADGSPLVLSPNYTPLTNSGSVKNVPGFIDGFTVAEGGTSISITIYDNTSATGTVIFGPHVLVDGESVDLFGAEFGTGCYVSFSGTTGSPSVTFFTR